MVYEALLGSFQEYLGASSLRMRRFRLPHFHILFLMECTSCGSVSSVCNGVFCFFYSNLARFKRFRGLGFEAELWEDKQKEAADLIDRLKNVVEIYTREIVMNNVMRGRWGGAEGGWQSRWNLLHELKGRHTELGQEIDFTDLQHDVESIFIFDICSPLASSVRQSIETAKPEARVVADQQFGSPISDLDGWNDFQKHLQSVVSSQDDLFERAKSENIAQGILNLAEKAKTLIKEISPAALVFNEDVIVRLKKLAEIDRRRPLEITPELLEWADGDNAFAK